jgi:hypothetical protein
MERAAFAVRSEKFLNRFQVDLYGAPKTIGRAKCSAQRGARCIQL